MSDSGDKSRRRTYALGVPIALFAAFGALFFTQPDVSAAIARVEQDRGRLHSDEVMLATQGAMDREHARLFARHRSIANGDGQGALMHELALIARRHSITIESVDAATPSNSLLQRRVSDELDQLALHVEMRGTYRALLASLDELSRISDGVRVEAPSFHWEGTTLGASVPLFLLRAHLRRGANLQ